MDELNGSEIETQYHTYTLYYKCSSHKLCQLVRDKFQIITMIRSISRQFFLVIFQKWLIEQFSIAETALIAFCHELHYWYQIPKIGFPTLTIRKIYYRLTCLSDDEEIKNKCFGRSEGSDYPGKAICLPHVTATLVTGRRSVSRNIYEWGDNSDLSQNGALWLDTLNYRPACPTHQWVCVVHAYWTKSVKINKKTESQNWNSKTNRMGSVSKLCTMLTQEMLHVWSTTFSTSYRVNWTCRLWSQHSSIKLKFSLTERNEQRNSLTE